MEEVNGWMQEYRVFQGMEYILEKSTVGTLMRLHSNDKGLGHALIVRGPMLCYIGADGMQRISVLMDFFPKGESSEFNWILAHELGHLMLGHLKQKCPTVSMSNGVSLLNSIELEIQADEFATHHAGQVGKQSLIEVATGLKKVVMEVNTLLSTNTLWGRIRAGIMGYAAAALYLHHPDIKKRLAAL